MIVRYFVNSFLDNKTVNTLAEAKKVAKELSVKNGEARIDKWIFPSYPEADYMDWDEAEIDPCFEIRYKNGKRVKGC